MPRKAAPLCKPVKTSPSNPPAAVKQSSSVPKYSYPVQPRYLRNTGKPAATGGVSGVVTKEAGLRLKNQPPIPKTFELNPLFDSAVASPLFAPKVGTQRGQANGPAQDGVSHNATYKQGLQEFSKSLQTQVMLKQQLTRQRIDEQRVEHRARLPPESFSVKFTTNKDMFAAYGVETVSDAFSTVELKRLNRQIQKQKRALRDSHLREMEAQRKREQIELQMSKQGRNVTLNMSQLLVEQSESDKDNSALKDRSRSKASSMKRVESHDILQRHSGLRKQEGGLSGKKKGPVYVRNEASPVPDRAMPLKKVGTDVKSPKEAG